MKTLTLEDYHAALKAQGVPRDHLAMKCPMCGTIQSAHDLIAAPCKAPTGNARSRDSVKSSF